MKPQKLSRWVAALIVLAAGAACRRPGRAEVFDELFPATPCPRESEYWYEVSIMDQPAGSMYVGISRCSGQRRLVESRTRLHLGGNEMTEEIKALVNPEYCPLRLRSLSRAQEEELILEAGLSQGSWLVVRGPEQRRLPREERARYLPTFRPLFPQGPPPPGKTVSYLVFDEEKGDWVEETLTADVEAVDTPPWRAQVRRPQEPLYRMELVLDGDLAPLESTIHLGRLRLSLSRAASEPETTAVQGKDPLKEFGSFPAPFSGVLSKLEKVTLRLSRPAEISLDDMDGPGQKVIGREHNVLLIEVSRPPAPADRPWPLQTPPELKIYLDRTALVQADDPRIQRLARQEVKGAGDALSAARALFHLVVRTIYSAEGQSVSTARGVLSSRRGDCDEQALLLVALARAAGIPARSVFGLLWENGAFWGHAWAELWVGQWVAMDPAQQAENIGPGWLRLGEIPLGLNETTAENWRRLWLMFADLKIEILTTEGK